MPTGQNRRWNGRTAKQLVIARAWNPTPGRIQRGEPKIVKPPTRSWWLDSDAFYEIAHEEAKRMSGNRKD